MNRASDLLPNDEASLGILDDRAEHLSKFKSEVDDHKELSRYIRFLLGKEYYGIPYDSIKEIMQGILLTPLPNAPDYIAGILNRRGSLLTIVDLKMFFQKQKTSIEKDTYVIVVCEKNLIIGFLAENIDDSDTYEMAKLNESLPSENILKADYITGIHLGKTAIINMATLVNDIQQQLEMSHM